MSHDGRNFQTVIRVSILIERYADELMRWDIVVEELLNAIAEGLPITIVLRNDIRKGVRIALLCGIPKRLASSVSNVLGSARDTDNIDLSTIFHEGIDGFQLSVPGCHIVESLVLDVIQWSSSFCN